MKVKFTGFAHTDSYAAADIKRWYAGETRTVDAAVGEKLIATFGDAFAVVGSSPKPKGRMIKKDAPDLSALDGSIAKLKAALSSGLLDSILIDLRNAEINGKTRKAAIEAIEARIAAL